MIEIKEIARLYTGQCGYKLIVGRLEHPIDLERTAAKQYYHLAERGDRIISGESVRGLRINLERGDDQSLCAKTEVIKSILYQRQNENVNETTCYILGDSFNLVSTIDFM